MLELAFIALFLFTFNQGFEALHKAGIIADALIDLAQKILNRMTREKGSEPDTW